MRSLFVLTILFLNSLVGFAFQAELNDCTVDFSILPTFERSVIVTSVSKIKENPQSLEIPEVVSDGIYNYTVTEIGRMAFFLCPPKLILPKTISKIESIPFGSVKELIIAEDNPYFKCIDGVVYNTEESKLITSLRHVNNPSIPKTVYQIEDYAFMDVELREIILPNNLQVIGISAFENCKNLESITIPESVYLLGASCFKSSGLKIISLPDNISSINDDMFAHTPLQDIKLPCNLIKIGKYAFYETKLSSVALPTTLTSIDDYAFDNSMIEEIIIPENVVSIGINAFSQVPIHSVVFEGEKCQLGLGVFSNCKYLYNIILPSELSEIPNHLFSGCLSLKSICLPNSCQKISSYAFSYCLSLHDIVFPVGLKQIGSNSFEYCDALGTIRLPQNFEKIYNNAFYCARIEELHLPSSLNLISNQAFYGCKVKDIYCYSEQPLSCGDVWDSWDYQYSNLNVPVGTINNYKRVSPWNKFLNVKEFYNSGIGDVINDSQKEIIAIYNLKGYPTTYNYDGPVIIQYSDGTCEKRIIREK